MSVRKLKNSSCFAAVGDPAGAGAGTPTSPATCDGVSVPSTTWAAESRLSAPCSSRTFENSTRASSSMTPGSNDTPFSSHFARRMATRVS